MKKNLKMTTMAIIAASIVSISLVGFADSFAHQTVYDGNVKLIIGHSDEPSYGHLKSIWLGMHNVNVLVNQDDIPIGDATLNVDKYYFKTAKKFNKADSLDDAKKESLGNVLSKKFGTDNLYEHRQIVSSGIYVYRVYGDVNGQEVDVTVSCFDEDMEEPAKFDNFETSSKKFSCPENIKELKFP